MVIIAAFPLVKIGLLFLKQLSKPVANAIKNNAKKHPLVRQYIIVPTGKAYSWVESTTLRKKDEYEKLTYEECVELGSNAIGEIVLFGLLTIILLAEMSRQGDKKATKAKIKEEQLVNMTDTLIEVIHDVEKLRKKIQGIDMQLQKSITAIEAEELSHELVNDQNMFDMFTNGNYTYKKLSDFKFNDSA